MKQNLKQDICIVLLVIIFLVVFMGTIWFALRALAVSKVHEPRLDAPQGNLVHRNSVIIQENSFKAVYSYQAPHTQVLGMMVETTFNDDEALADLLEKIIDCENPKKDPMACNQEYGCQAGMGMAMIIPSTGEYCEEKLGRKLNLFDKQDNLDCAMWLLENEGIRHWGCPECDWGTWSCWSK